MNTTTASTPTKTTAPTPKAELHRLKAALKKAKTHASCATARATKAHRAFRVATYLVDNAAADLTPADDARGYRVFRAEDAEQKKLRAEDADEQEMLLRYDAMVAEAHLKRALATSTPPKVAHHTRRAPTAMRRLMAA